MRTLSPLRYPGGKFSIRYFILSTIQNNSPIKNFVEPYAGGAGISIWLLSNNYVKRVYLNDKDELIYAFWDSLLHNSKEFIKLFDSTIINIDEWYKQKAIIEDKDKSKYSQTQIGFATFFINRCNRSGIITKQVGPIGGKKQTGDWKIDARFNKINLRCRLMDIIKLKGKISIANCDAIDYINNLGLKAKNTFYYFDPPYFDKGATLYREFYNYPKHQELHNFLQNFTKTKWMVSYDNAEYIRNLYSDFHLMEIKINHQAQSKKSEKELIIYPESITMKF